MQLTQGLHRSLQTTPDRTATVFGARVRTFREQADRVARLAGGFHALGVGVGDRVGILASNSDRYAECLLAVPWLGLAQAARHDPALFCTDAIKVCDWWCRHLPSERVAYWDFDAAEHEPQPLLDTSATSIAAAALLKMRSITSDRAEAYERVARDMVTAVVDRHVNRRADPARAAGIVGDACYDKRIGLATRNEVVWGTYFLLEALLTLTGRVDASNV